MENRQFPTKLLGYKSGVIMSHIMGIYSCEADAELFWVGWKMRIVRK